MSLFLALFLYAVVGKFLKTFRKFTGKRLWCRTFLGKFQFLKMDSAMASFYQFSKYKFYGCIQTLNKYAFLWMITLFGAKNPESSKICQTIIAFSYQATLNTIFFIPFTRKFSVFFEKHSKQKFMKLERSKPMCLVFKFDKIL